jgi:hypothetical protein
MARQLWGDWISLVGDSIREAAASLCTSAVARLAKIGKIPAPPLRKSGARIASTAGQHCWLSRNLALPVLCLFFGKRGPLGASNNLLLAVETSL